jgi:DNA repair protein RecO (recombination protein O)
MPENFSTLAVILKKEAYRERDSKVTLFSPEQGLMSVVARGTADLQSKMSGHLEAFGLASLRVVGGRRHLYAAGARQELAFLRVKSDYERLAAAGEAARVFLRAVKPGLPDAALYRLLLDFLSALEIAPPAKAAYLKDLFVFKLSAALGQAPELYHCIADGARLKAEANYWSPARGGVACPAHRGRGELTISPNCLKIMRLALNSDFSKLLKIRVNKGLLSEINRIVEEYQAYHQA